MSRIITSIILLMTMMGFCGCGLSRRNTDDIDGGVKTYNSGENSPKVVDSTEIISFEFEVSLYNIVVEEESELVGRNYKLSAVLEDGAVKSEIKTAIKKALVAAQAKDSEAVSSALSAVYKLCDKAVGKGVLHKNTAARKKSRLTVAINK